MAQWLLQVKWLLVTPVKLCISTILHPIQYLHLPIFCISYSGWTSNLTNSMVVYPITDIARLSLDVLRIWINSFNCLCTSVQTKAKKISSFWEMLYSTGRLLSLTTLKLVHVFALSMFMYSTVVGQFFSPTATVPQSASFTILHSWVK